MKKGLIYFFTIIVILLGAVITIPGFLNWNEYKSQVTDTLYSQTGHKISVDGNLVMKILPSPMVSAEGLTLLHPDGSAFLSLDSLNVNVGFFALLSGRIEARSLLLKGGKLSLSRNEEGVGNWEFLLPEQNQPKSNNAETHSFDHVGVENLEVVYDDKLLGRSDVFHNIDAVVKAASTKGPFDINTTYTYGGVQFEMEASSGRIETARSFPLSLNLIVAEQNPGLNFQGTVVLDGEASAASGQFKAEGGSLGSVVTGLSLLANGNAPAEFSLNLDQNFKLEAPVVLTKARVTARPFAIEVGDAVGEGELLVSPKGEGGTTAELGLKLNSITLENWLRPKSEINSDENALVGLPLRLNYQLEVSVINYGDETARRNTASGFIDQTRFRLDAGSSLMPGGTEIKLAGGFNLVEKPVFRGNVDINSNNFRRTLTWLGQDLSTLPDDVVKKFALRSVVALSQNQVAVSGATGQLDGTSFDGRFSYNNENTPIYKANLNLSSFNVDSYFPTSVGEKTNETWQSTKKTIEDSLKKLSAYQAEIAIKANKFSFADARFNDLVVEGKLVENVLNLSRFSTSDFKGVKGSLSGRVVNLTASPSFNFTMDLTTPSLSALTRWSGVELPVDVYKLAATSVKGSLGGSLDQLNLNIEGRTAQANYSVKGSLAELSPTPKQMDVQIVVGGNDHQDFIRRMDIPLQLQGEGMGFNLVASLKGKPSALATELGLDIIGGKLQAVGVVNVEASEPSFEVEIEANHARLVNVAKALNWQVATEDESLGRLQVLGSLKANAGVYETSQLRGVFGPSQFRADIRYDTSKERATLAGSVNVDGLPLSRFLTKSTTGATSVKQAGGRRWSRKPFELDYLRELDIELAFAADMISFEKYNYNNPQFQLSLKDGLLNINQFKGNMFNGRVLGQLRLDVNSVPRGSVSLTLEDASLKQALEASAAISPASGNLSLRSDIAFVGVSQFDMVSSMQGNVEIWAQNGVIKGVDIDRIARRMARLNRLPDFLSLLNSGLAGGETPFGNIRTNFIGERGVFSARSVVADIEGADVDGNMTIDLPKWGVTGSGVIQFNEVELPPLAPQTREVVDATGQVTIEEMPAPPVRDVPPIGVDISGDIDDPAISYRTNRLRSFMAERFTSSLFNNIISGGGLGGVLGGEQPATEQPATQPQGLQNDVNPQETQQPPTQVNPADVIVRSLFDLLQPQQPEPQPEEPN